MLSNGKNNKDIDIFAKSESAAADLPVHPPMAKKMNVDVIVNKNSQVWLAHDAPFPGVLQWVEYDVDTGMMTFVTDDGKIQDLGFKISQVISRYLRQSTTIDTILVLEQKIHDFYRVPLLVRESLQ